MGFLGNEYFNNSPTLIAIILFLAAECAKIFGVSYFDNKNFKEI